MRIGLVLIGLLLADAFLFGGTALSQGDFPVDSDILKNFENRWGKEAATRLNAWGDLIRSGKNASDRDKLEKVNAFMNNTMAYAEDIDVWGVDDYWATPQEFIGKGRGDCEDYAIAKYFTLKVMGVAERKLNIAYVKALQLNRTHMVVTYTNLPGDEPLILDNLIDKIKPASERTDLMPIFTFNGTELWMAHERGQGKSTNSSRLRPWRDLLNRMSDDNLFVK